MPSLKLLILQIATILLLGRIVSWLFRKLRQPGVVGEMVVGILLGPSVLGLFAPQISASLFPLASLGYLSSLSQIGLVLFMFLVGLELDLNQLRRLGRPAVITSLVSIIVPFFLGFLLAFYLYPRLSDQTVSFTGFALFMSIAMSITAFPVLARILNERNLLRTRVGSMAITCAAVDDVTAWCVLAGIMVIVRSPGSELPMWLVLIGLIALIFSMLYIVRPLMSKLIPFYDNTDGLTHSQIALILLVVLGSALVTEYLGVHALFGAFLAGIVMPRHDKLPRELFQKIEAPITVLLLPIYFAFTGLRSSFFLIVDGKAWLYCLLIIALAVAGKLGAASISARMNGMSWREATAIGVLMNTRGLVELVILNIGLDLGILSPTLFSMMVLMALMTTLMTTPILGWIYPEHAMGTVKDDLFKGAYAGRYK
jgi:Kef-type K+ transport system membrane component KefB